jgi:Cdc6-like AAA superfamily ATPase
MAEPRLVWQIVLGRDTRPALAEKLVKLRSEVLQAAFRKDGLLPPFNPGAADLVESYVCREVSEPLASRYEHFFEIDVEHAKGSALIRQLKEEHNERAESLTYEHLLAERIAEPEYNIVLVGATGSGKTHTLEYVWRKYVEPHADCEGELPGCPRKTRVRLRYDLDKREQKTAAEFYEDLYRQVVSTLIARIDSAELSESYQEFVGVIHREFQSGKDITYLHTLEMLGVDSKELAPGLSSLIGVCEPRLRRDLVLFLLHFCGWLVRTRRKKPFLCLFLEIDNIDASPAEVQDAVVSLLTNTDPEQSLLIVCACRPPTLRRWHARKEVLDVIPHIGPSAYDVVMHRLARFVSNPSSAAKLDDLLQHTFPAVLFLKNLEHVHERLRAQHFQTLLDDLFGWHVRDGLVFAQGIIDLCASNRGTELRTEDGKSDYALERMLYSPLGLVQRSGHLVNIYALCRQVEQRLAPLRILMALKGAGPWAMDVHDVCEHMRPFGYDNERVIRVLNSMLQAEVVLAATRERYQLGEYAACHDEALNVTRTGEGTLSRSRDMTYVEACMYECYTRSGNYTRLSYSVPSFADALLVLREFLSETASIDLEEVRSMMKSGDHSHYEHTYEGKTISWSLYGSILRTVLVILKSEAKKGHAEAHQAGTLVADKMVNDCARHAKEAMEIGLTLEGGAEFRRALTEIQRMAAGLPEE